MFQYTWERVTAIVHKRSRNLPRGIFAARSQETRDLYTFHCQGLSRGRQCGICGRGSRRSVAGPRWSRNKEIGKRSSYLSIPATGEILQLKHVTDVFSGNRPLLRSVPERQKGNSGAEARCAWWIRRRRKDIGTSRPAVRNLRGRECGASGLLCDVWVSDKVVSLTWGEACQRACGTGCMLYFGLVGQNVRQGANVIRECSCRAWRCAEEIV